MKLDWANGELLFNSMDCASRVQFLGDVVLTAKWLSIFADDVIGMTSAGLVRSKFYAVPKSGYTVVMLGDLCVGHVCKVVVQKLSEGVQQFVEWTCLPNNEYLFTCATQDVSLIVTVFKLIDSYKFNRYMEVEGFIKEG